MAQPPLPTLQQVFALNEDSALKNYSFNDVPLRTFVNSCAAKGADPLHDDDWTPFAEGIAAWAQRKPATITKWDKKLAKAAFSLINTGYFYNAQNFTDWDEGTGKTAALECLNQRQRDELKIVSENYRIEFTRHKFSCLNLATEDEPCWTSETNQGSPSEMGKDSFTPRGVGHMVFNEFDPSPSQNVHKCLIPDPQAPVDEETLRIQHVFLANATARGIVPLKEDDSIQPRYNDFAKDIGWTAQASSTKYSILGSPSAAKSSGKMDGSFSMESPLDPAVRWALGVWEVKGQEASPFVAIRQAGTGYGFGIATFLVGLGIPVDEIVVPVVLYTSVCVQFGAVFVLEPSFPVFTLVSCVFDLSRKEQALDAARHVIKIRHHCIETGLTVEKEFKKIMKHSDYKEPPKDFLSSMTIALSKKRYFLKAVRQSQTDSPPKGFELVGQGQNSESGAYHMIRVYGQLDEALATSERSSVCFPICFREKGGSEPLSLVFEDLKWDNLEGGPYRVGLPPDGSLWAAWLKSVQDAIDGIHKAGVVHVDLYPSNIMWRRKGNGGSEVIEVKLIDFDVAHLNSERQWKVGVHQILSSIAEERRDLGWSMFETVDVRWDLQYVEVLRCLIPQLNDEGYEGIRDGLTSGDVGKINDAFREAVHSITIKKE